MKRTSIILAVALTTLVAQPLLAGYTSIQHNLVDGVADTSLIGGVLTISQSGMTDGLSLNDDGLAGTPEFQNIDVFMTTTMSGYVTQPPANPIEYPNGYAEFTGGSYSLSFDYREDPGDPWVNYGIAGNIVGFRAHVQYSNQLPDSSWVSEIKGEGLFPATYVNLPGSGDWAALPPDLSSIQTLTLQIGLGLDGWMWNTDLTGGNTQYTLFPNAEAAPEPASLMLVLLGGIGIMRRRRA